MTLLQIRTKFREISGRFDLVNADYSDNGADFYINEGRKFLDRLDETQKSWAAYYKTLSADGYAVSFPYCRAVKEVWAANSESRWQLEKKNLQDILTEYFANIDEMESGTPLYYSPCISRYIPETLTLVQLQAFSGHLEIAPVTHEYNALIVNVPTDEDITIIINGLFYSAELVEETDVNYWSEVHPMLLIMAAMRQLEIVHRNTQGVNDWTASIMAEMQQLGYDLVEELIAEADQMEG